MLISSEEKARYLLRSSLYLFYLSSLTFILEVNVAKMAIHQKDAGLTDPDSESPNREHKLKRAHQANDKWQPIEAALLALSPLTPFQSPKSRICHKWARILDKIVHYMERSGVSHHLRAVGENFTLKGSKTAILVVRNSSRPRSIETD